MKELTFSYLYRELTKQNSLLDVKGDLKLLFEFGACFLTPAESTGLATFFKFMSGTGLTAGNRVIDLFKGQQPVSYSDHVLRMREAYAAICLTAFFDTLAAELPQEINEKIRLLDVEKKRILEEAGNCEITEKDLNQPVVLPDLVFNCDKVYKYLGQLYKKMALRLQYFVSKLAFSDTASDRDFQEFKSTVESLPEHALDSFKDQYLMLCAACPEFYIYIQLGKEHELAADMEEKYRTLLAVATRTEAVLTQGLSDFHTALISAHAEIREREVREVIETLRRTYRETLDDEVIETHDGEQLKFPTIGEAFIPQSFRLLPYTGEERLEQPDTWRDLEPFEDMDTFLAKYALATEGVDRLLLILGEPGGGKTLLTKVLAARLSDEGRLCVRIPLRAYTMENHIEHMVCRQIEEDGRAEEKGKTFKWYAKWFHGEPITLLFDGYDEVQQATGASYHRFLRDLEEFQQECFRAKLPVRVVVTSRATLIDKAEIPRGTLVMKLDDFDRARQELWRDIWNSYNHAELARCGLADFALPEEGSKLAELARQPLLLLMLSMYDADFDKQRNAIRQADEAGESLNRTQLYNELLRRFIRRELEKGKRGTEYAFKEEHDDAKKEARINAEMQKLGIAALGMFAREKLSITVAELEADFRSLNARLPAFEDSGRSLLKNEEIFLGSFFFIHDSRSRSQRTEDESTPNMREPGASFVFLHKTFYEFLVADLVLQNYFDYILDLVRVRLALEDIYVGKKAELSRKFTPFYLSVGAACLCAEPEILRMIREWKADKLKACLRTCPNADERLVPEVIRDVFDAHFKLIRDGAFQKMDTLIPERTQPQLCAVYLLNTVILEALVCESFSVPLADWRFCAQYIKLNAPRPKEKPAEPEGKKRRFSLEPSEELPLQFMALFEVGHTEGLVSVKLREQPVDFEKRSLLDARRELFSFAQEETDRLLYTLHDEALPPEERWDILYSLNGKGMGLRLEESLARLENAIMDDRQEAGRSWERLLDETVRLAYFANTNPVPLFDWLLKLRQCTLARPPYGDYKFQSHFSEYVKHVTYEIGRSLSQCNENIREQCLLLWIDILKMTGENQSLSKLLDNDTIGKLSGDCFYALVNALPFRLKLDEECIVSLKMAINGDFEFSDTPSPKWFAALLISLWKYILPAEYEPLIGRNYIIESFVERALRSHSGIRSIQTLTELPVLLRECLRLGKGETVKDYLERVSLPYDLALERTPALRPALPELLEIEEFVGGDRLKEKFGRLLTDPEYYDFHNAKDCRLALRTAGRLLASRAQEHSADTLIVGILKRYDYVFSADPPAAVSLLNQLVEHNADIPDELIPKAVSWSLRSYFALLRLSVPVSAKLLSTAAKLGPTRYEHPELCLPECYLRLLDAALSERDRRSDSLLKKTLDSLSAGVQNRLITDFRPDLQSRMPFIKRIFPGLANTIQRRFAGKTVTN